MIRFSTLLWGMCALWGPYSFAQNLIPNPGFENHSTCPTGNAQFVGYVSNWLQSNTATTDYSACGYNGNVAIWNIAASGNSSVGIWGGSGHPSCPGSAYSEPIRTNLISPMSSGKDYLVEIKIRVDPMGTATAAPNGCVDFGMYFYNSNNPPNMAGWCCNSVSPQWQFSASLIPEGPYATFNQVIQGGNWDAVIIGPFCNDNTANAPCTNYNLSRMYFNLDDILVEEITFLDGGDLSLEGKPYASFNALQWRVELGHPYDRFVLERSADAQHFSAIDAQYVRSSDIETYQYRDMGPLDGANYYRLTAFTSEGEEVHTDVVELKHGINSVKGGVLNFAYAPGEDEIRIELEAISGGKYDLEAVDMQGRIIHEKTWQLASGNHELRMPTFNIAHGMYLLRLRAVEDKVEWAAKWLR